MTDELIEINNQTDIKPILRAVEDPQFDIPDAFYTEAPAKIWQIIKDMIDGKWLGEKDGKTVTPSGLRRMFGILMAMDNRNRGQHAGPGDEDEPPMIHVEGDMKIAIQIVNKLSDAERAVLDEASKILARIEQEQAELQDE